MSILSPYSLKRWLTRWGLATALVAVASAWALRLGLEVVRRPPAELSLGGKVLFVTAPSEVLALWAVGLLPAVVAAAARAGRWRRAAIAALAVGAIALLAVVIPALLEPPRAELQQLSPGAPLPENERQTLLLAIDGLTWKQLLPLAESGELPNFARLMSEGSYGALHSYRTRRPSTEQWGYWSPVVWTTVATGLPVEAHGIRDFTLPDAEGVERMADSRHRRAPAFWNLFTAFERPLGVVGWWATWPAEKVAGVMVSSGLGLRNPRGGEGGATPEAAWLRRGRGLVHPKRFKRVIRRRVGLPEDIDSLIEEELFPLQQYPLRSAEDRETLRSVLWQDELYLAITRHLLKKRDLNLLAVYLEGIDAVSHHFWEFMAFPEAIEKEAPELGLPPGFTAHTEVVANAYRLVDRRLGDLLGRLPPEATVLIVSDHGFKTWPGHTGQTDHSPYGVFLARGPGIARGRNLNLSLAGSLRDAIRGPLSVFDVLPTLLYLHDLPVSAELERLPRLRIFEAGYLAQHDILLVAGYGDFALRRKVQMDLGESEEYRRRLRSLGYLD